MEIPITPTPPAQSPVSAGQPATALVPGAPAAADAGHPAAQHAPDFARLLAAGLGGAEPAGDLVQATAAPAAGDDSRERGTPAADGSATAIPDASLSVVFALMALPGGAAAPHPAAAGTEASAAGAHAPDADAAASRSRGATAVAAEPRSPLTRTEAEAASAAPQARPGSAAAQASALARQEADGTPEASRARADETPQTPTLLQVWDTAAQRTSQHAVHAPAAAELRAPVGTEAWDAQLGRSLTWMAGERHQIAEVRLNPPELGPLQIVLHLGGDDGNQASVSFSSPHADVRAALETALPRLREMLAESGISLGQANVNAEAFRDGGGERQPASGGNAVPGAAVSGSHALPAAVRGGTGLVDIFA